MVTALPARGREATLPFIGFAEAYVLSAFRHAGVPMQRIRPAVDYLRCVTYGDDGWASQLRLPSYEHAKVTVNPRRLLLAQLPPSVSARDLPHKAHNPVLERVGGASALAFGG